MYLVLIFIVILLVLSWFKYRPRCVKKTYVSKQTTKFIYDDVLPNIVEFHKQRSTEMENYRALDYWNKKIGNK